jgi:hypothetical protein
MLLQTRFSELIAKHPGAAQLPKRSDKLIRPDFQVIADHSIKLLSCGPTAPHPCVDTMEQCRRWSYDLE